MLNYLTQIDAFGTSIHPSTQITLSRIGQYGNDALAFGFGCESQLEGSMDGSTRGYADDEAFVVDDVAIGRYEQAQKRGNSMKL